MAGEKTAKVIGESKLTRKGQVTIPKVVRVLLELQPGDKIRFLLEDYKVYIEKVKEPQQ